MNVKMEAECMRQTLYTFITLVQLLCKRFYQHQATEAFGIYY